MSTEDEKPSFEKLRTMVTVPEVLELLGIEVTSGDKFTSPYNPSERTPSAHAYEDHFFDFSTGKGGDVVDLVQAVQPELTPGRILFLLWTKALKAGKQIGDVEQQKPRVLDRERLTEIWKADGSGRHQEWRDHLGVSPPITVNVRKDGTLAIAHWDEEGVYGIKYRDMRGKKWSEPGSQFTHRLYHPWGWGHTDHRPYAVICEGESDCWALDEKLGHRKGVYTFALPSGASSWKDHWIKDLEPFETIYICTDNDRAGKDARDKIHRKMHWDRTKDLMVPQLFGDAREAIRAGWIPKIS